MKQPTKEMKEFFDFRTYAHIKRVQDNIQKVISNKDFDAELLKSRLLNHDKSKYSNEEYIPYVWLTWYKKEKNIGRDFKYPEGVEKEVDKACLHHIKNNRHHPEFFLALNEMNCYDIIEMVCDWAAMSQELGTSLLEWVDKNVGSKWNFDDEQVKLIYGLVDIFCRK